MWGLMKSLVAKIDDLSDEVRSLRKQLARVEAKSAVNQRQSTVHPNDSGMLSNHLNDDVYLDFELTLNKEGLPIKTLDGVIALENKLTESSFEAMSYRQRLVILFLRSAFN